MSSATLRNRDVMLPKGSLRRELPRNEGEGERVQMDLYVAYVEHLFRLCRNLLHRFAEPPLGGSLTLDLYHEHLSVRMRVHLSSRRGSLLVCATKPHPPRSSAPSPREKAHVNSAFVQRTKVDFVTATTLGRRGADPYR